MATATGKVRRFLFPFVGLLVLAGMSLSPGPAGVVGGRATRMRTAGRRSAAEDPRVAAEQVEDGGASLTDFALAARDQFASDSDGHYDREAGGLHWVLVRQEGSLWRSGPTYLVQLTPDGRVFVHAKDMSMSGRLLNPGFMAPSFRRWASARRRSPTPPPPSRPSLAAAGNGGPFNVSGMPGASGYATVYLSVNLQIPVVLLAGFDIVESHLVPVSRDDIDYGDPPITATDVVDRSTR